MAKAVKSVPLRQRRSLPNPRGAALKLANDAGPIVHLRRRTRLAVGRFVAWDESRDVSADAADRP